MYTKSFYELQKKQNIKSAEKIVPIIKKLLFENAEHDKLTVCDVGCGSGNWLYVFKKYGFKVTGIDRNPYMDRGMLEKDEFVQYDFESGKNKKPPLEDRFGLVICLEVLEHLPEKYADNMIDLLVNCSDYVLFSAAVPLQGGTGHVNEQWQSYWVKKFEKKGYILCDCIRPLIWDDDEITFFYRQNIMLFAKDCKTDFKLINQNGGVLWI